MRVRDLLRKKSRVHGKSKKNYKSKKAWFIARAAVAFKNNLVLPMGGSGDNRNLSYVTKFIAVGKRGSRKAEFKHKHTTLNYKRQ
jgi:hypothetical protein